MNRLNRKLSLLLALLMLLGTWGASAEPATEIDMQDSDGIELAIELEDGADEALELSDELALDGLELADLDLAIASEDVSHRPGDEQGADANTEDGDDDYNDEDFKIVDGVLEEYLGSGGDVVIPSTVTRIGQSAFYDCTALTGVTIPDGVISIGNYAFKWCSKLASVNIPDSVVGIGDDAFWSCDSLTSVNIPASVTSIGYSSFGGCDRLKSITVASGNPNYISKNGVLYTKDMKTLLTFPGAKTSITIPTSVKTIEDWAFASSQLTKISVPKNVTRIGEDAFYSCSKLSSVTLAKGLTTIALGAFEDCTSLKSITVPSSVKVIEGGAFYGCKRLTRVNILSKQIKVYDYYYEDEDDEEDNRYYTFQGCPSSLTLYTVVGSDAAEWGRSYGVKVVENLLLLSKNITQKLAVKGTLQIKLENATAKSYASSNKKIATVSAKGLVTAKGIGKAKITVKLSSGKKRVLTVNVPDPAALSDTKLTLAATATTKLKLTGALKRKVTWASSDSSVVKITKGTTSYASLKALKAGSATITAKVAGGKTLKCKVTVVNPLTIKKSSLNDSGKLYLKFTNNSDKKIIYIRFDILQYNNRGDRLQSPYSYYYLNDDLPAHSEDTYYYWVNEDTRSIKIKITEVTFADKTTWKP